MGLRLWASSCRCNNCSPSVGTTIVNNTVNVRLPNPDPKKWKLVFYFETRDMTILQVKYEGCTNYEGNKIMVFDLPYKELMARVKKCGNVLDPHFCPHAELKLVARFVPTSKGMSMAQFLCENYPRG